MATPTKDQGQKRNPNKDKGPGDRQSGGERNPQQDRGSDADDNQRNPNERNTRARTDTDRDADDDSDRSERSSGGRSGEMDDGVENRAQGEDEDR